MNELELFRWTRLKLAGGYAGVMAFILGISGFGIYEAIDHAHRVAADRKLQAIAVDLHARIEPTLQEPGRITQSTRRILPELCLVEDCEWPRPDRFGADPSAGEILKSDHYVVLLCTSGNLVAQDGSKPTDLPVIPPSNTWVTLKADNRIRYRQITLPLQHVNQSMWGYLQVGSSLEESDQYLDHVRFILLAGLPLVMVFVGIASWVLSKRAMRPLYQSFQNMRQFTADVAHELRTPITAAQATVESVQESDLSPQELQQTFQAINRQHRRLAQLVRDLMLLTRLDQTLPLQDQQSVCLQDLVSDICEELAALALSHRIQLTQAVAKLPLFVKGQEAQLYRLVLNLVMNAILYTPAGGEVTLDLRRVEGSAVLQVTDTGVGLSPDHQKKIFNRFYRANHDRSRQTGGSGLGLSIAQAIAQAHQGRITVKSQLNQGSTFTLWLPIA